MNQEAEKWENKCTLLILLFLWEMYIYGVSVKFVVYLYRQKGQVERYVFVKCSHMLGWYSADRELYSYVYC